MDDSHQQKMPILELVIPNLVVASRQSESFNQMKSELSSLQESLSYQNHSEEEDSIPSAFESEQFS